MKILIIAIVILFSSLASAHAGVWTIRKNHFGGSTYYHNGRTAYHSRSNNFGGKTYYGRRGAFARSRRTGPVRSFRSFRTIRPRYRSHWHRR